MNPARWAVLVLVLAALGASVGYGLKDKGSDPPPDLRPLQEKAGLAPCPTGLGQGFPDLTLPCLGGGDDVRISRAGPGRPMLVNVYGSWCLPCQKEMPVLAQLHAEAGDKVALVGVDTEDLPRAGLQFAIDMGQSWPALVDDDRRVGAHFQPGVPLMVFVEPDGDVAHVESGGYTSLAELEADLRTYLGVAL